MPKKKQPEHHHNPEQFNKFWELKCPACGKIMSLEVIINSFRDKICPKRSKR